ncbi:GNAT family N-acetyltransferase [Flavobacterium cerinum]|uniref:N-acetyltransferase n=1 Tax=Flavobacterium cerinum TaxID=2502784 RepID=A0A444HDQ0_9FLAO|nr:GNAT family N-acetyltransferase [Flavobacterium cerinum]RWX02411.1 N-acetyltransferase [Flavobacterium cerinum]
MIHLLRTDSTNTDFQKLVALLDTDLRIRDGEDHAFYSQYNKIQAIKHVVVAYQNDEPVGCGAIKEYEQGTMEVKRMYVSEDKRGSGIASAILKELEIWTAQLGYNKCILETGIRQPEAIALYKKNNYSIIINYGQYTGIENSVCFEKTLK